MGPGKCGRGAERGRTAIRIHNNIIRSPKSQKELKIMDHQKNETAKFCGSKSCENKSSGRSDKGSVLASGWGGGGG